MRLSMIIDMKVVNSINTLKSNARIDTRYSGGNDDRLRQDKKR